MGRVTGPFGVLGWIKIHPYTETPASLTRYGRWWLGREAPYAEHEVVQSRVHGAQVLAKLAGIDDRDQAARLKGQWVVVPRGALPSTGEDEYYWVDLIGLTVVNTEGTSLGTVRELMETGANDVLVVQGERERLIPFIRQVILDVDLAEGIIRVDWGVDY
ncbi:MAG: ribosome maturation factor RimM [Burkholderiales bacterium]